MSLSISVARPVIPSVAESLIQSSEVKFAGWVKISPPTSKNFSKSLSVFEDIWAKPTK
jgi:hypothetical protein